MFTASRDCRIIGDLLEGHALNVLDPVRRARSAPTWRPVLSAGTSITVWRPWPRTCPVFAGPWRTARQAAVVVPVRAAGGRRGARHRRRRHGAARGAPAASLTLSQWVSRLACVR
ncbi:zf-HC2 domain-containing protein [Streptomyces sp. INA 01156]